MARAVRTGRKVEVTALRTATSTTWAKPDGGMAARLHSSAVRAKSNGVWKPIDLDLRRTAEGWEPTVSNTRIVFSAGSSSSGTRPHSAVERASRTAPRGSLAAGVPRRAGTNATAPQPLASMRVGPHTIDLTWPGPVPAPIVEGNRALYPELFPGADLVLTADDIGFAPVLVLKTPQAAAHPLAQRIEYGLGSSTLSFRLDPLSGMVSALDSEGEEAALSPTPFMWDSSGQQAVTDGGVGEGSQPTEPEAPEPTDPAATAPEATPSPSEAPVTSDERSDPENEVLPTATDGPQTEPTRPPLPAAPPEPAPEPSRTGAAATLGLPSLNGPAPDSRGELVEPDLNGNIWSLTPDQEFLTDPATTYPVFVDPAFSKKTAHWTTTYSRHPNATFYNGRGFNKAGTHEARVGFESDTWGTSRSFFNIEVGDQLDGVRVKSAALRTLATYAWSCSARSMSVHLTSEINGRTNWRNAPKLHDGNKYATRSFAHGWKASSCPDKHVEFDLRAAVQKHVDGDDDGVITFGMRARDEKSQHAWKKFRATKEDGPALEIEYNRRPGSPTRLDLEPEAKCTTAEPYVRVGADEVTLSAQAADKDGNLDLLDFDLWPTGKWDTAGDGLPGSGKVHLSDDQRREGKGTSRPFSTKGQDGVLFSWRVRAVDAAKDTSPYSPAGTPCRFVVDRKVPKAPRVSSTDFPNADESENGFGAGGEDSVWSAKKFGTPGSFTFRALDSDVVRYEYGFNSSSFPGSVNRTAGTSVTVSATVSNAKPPTAGPNVLMVRTVDQVGHVSPATAYLFYVTPRDQADSPGDFTGDAMPDLFAVTEGGNLALYPSQGRTDDVLKGSGDLDYSMPGAYQDNKERNPNGGDGEPPHEAAGSGHFKGSLITHNGDVYGGDGFQDLIARVGGKLWVYPGDGYGAVNVDRRREILLPEGAPAPSTFTQIVSAGDVTGDGLTDVFVTVGDALWVLTGAQGATVGEATRLTSSPWAQRDLVSAYDMSGDGVADLVYRSDTGKLMLRKGKPATGGGVDLSSLAAAANSAGGADSTYGATGWSAAEAPFVVGTPDADDDGIGDIWSVRGDGSVRFHTGSRTALVGGGSTIITAHTRWKTRIAVG